MTSTAELLVLQRHSTGRGPAWSSAQRGWITGTANRRYRLDVQNQSEPL